MTRAPLVATMLLLVTATTACGGDGGPEVVGTTVPDADEITVVAVDFSFDPSTIEITAGTPVNIVLQVDDGTHNFVVPEADFEIPERDGGSAVATLVMDEPGRYVFGCSLLGHAEEGMVGTVIVR